MVVRWIRVCIGCWLILSPWLLGFSGITLMKWNSVGSGTILVLLGAWEIFGNDKKTDA